MGRVAGIPRKTFRGYERILSISLPEDPVRVWAHRPTLVLRVTLHGIQVKFDF